MIILLTCLTAVTTTDAKFTASEVNQIVVDVLAANGAKHHKRVAVIRKQMMAIPSENLRQWFVLNRLPVFKTWQVSMYLVPPVYKGRELKGDKRAIAFATWVGGMHRTRNIEWWFKKRRESGVRG